MQDDLFQTFLEETAENLQSVEEGLIDLERDPHNAKNVDNVFRAIHTIKGGAGLVGLTLVNDLAHHFENLLESVRQGRVAVSGEVISLLFEGMDLLKRILDSENLEDPVFVDPIETIKESLEFYLVQVEKNPKERASEQKRLKTSRYQVDLRFCSDLFSTGTDPFMLIWELAEKGTILSVLLNTEELPPLSELDPHKVFISWTIVLESEEAKETIEDIFIFVQEDNPITVRSLDAFEVDLEEEEDFEQEEEALGALTDTRSRSSETTNFRDRERASTIRVDTEKLETVLNSMAELLISQSRVKELVSSIAGLSRSAHVEIFNGFLEVDKIIRRVQEEIMNTSMIPIGGTFSRFQRMVRDLARDQKKEVELLLQGTEAELDKKVIEQMVDPLKHLLRNSVDHGLESSEERVAKGKPAHGTIVLSAYHQEGHFVIEISDDGRGINQERVLAKAIERGLVAPEDTLTKNEIERLIFLPGFSTAEKVSDLSGRGVGLDVVATNIQNMRGSVEVRSQKDKGTTFLVRLPLTLAIIDGMIVRVGEEKFIIPLTSISEFVKIEKKDLRRVESKGLIVHLRNEYIPFAALYGLLDLQPEFRVATEGIIIVVKDGRKKLALLVDEIVGQEQVVIKSLADNFTQVQGMAGATILGDGNVAIILEVPALFELAKAQNVVVSSETA